MRSKEKLLKWLYANQETITFPIIYQDQVWATPVQIFTFMENISTDPKKKRFIFMIDTSILDSRFEDYVAIDVREVDYIGEAWKTFLKSDPEFPRYQLGIFEDIPLKLLFTLKQIYNPQGDFQNGKYHGNVQKLTAENLDNHLGRLNSRLTKHITNRCLTRANDISPMRKKIKGIILDCAFRIAVERNWLMSMPSISNEVYSFNINQGYFAPQKTARLLSDGRKQTTAKA
jgi:hypothetical protein